MSDIKLLNQQNVKQVLLTDWDGHAAPKQVSKEALAWVNQTTLAVCRNLVASGRRSPSGRLMAPRMDPGLMARYLARAPEEIAGVAVAPGGAMVGGEVAVDAEWGPYHEWQQAVRTGATKLKFEEWKEQRK